jgi:hypothetical protein
MKLIQSNATMATTIRVQEGTTSEVASNIPTSSYVLYSQIYKHSTETLLPYILLPALWHLNTAAQPHLFLFL